MKGHVNKNLMITRDKSAYCKKLMHDCTIWYSSLVDSFVNVSDVTRNHSQGNDGTIFNFTATPETRSSFLSLARCSNSLGCFLFS